MRTPNLKYLLPISVLYQRGRTTALASFIALGEVPTREQLDMVVAASTLAALTTCFVEESESIEVVLN